MNIQETLQQKLGKEIAQASNEEIYGALLSMVQEMAGEKERTDSKKKLYYISAEFLIGKLLSNNMINLGIFNEVKDVLAQNGKNIAEIEEVEPEPSLGNGGLGRLAACFLDSIATLGLAGDGVGLNYHLGLFKQEFKNNLQRETPNPWIEEKSWLKKTDVVYPVSFKGLNVNARMYDIEVTGYNNKTNKLHLFDIDSVDETIVEDGITFDKEDIDSCIHFAGLKAVGESVVKPWEYYENNIAGTLTLVDVMRKHGVKNIIFSSSATVYGDPAQIPITEECPKGQCTNPYGWTKSMLEQIFMDLYRADNDWNIILLRYFNPIGAHKSGKMGENPNGIPNNLMPYITQVAAGKREKLGVFGNDYDTPDGTGVRDYIHVVDLAKGHVKAIDKIQEDCGLKIYNLGTGVGYSVLDIVHNFEKATGVKIPYTIEPRRAGDIATCYCDPSKAAKELGWKAENGIEEMCADSWRWQSNNPNGYDK